LFHVGSSRAVASLSPLASVSRSRRSVGVSLAIWMLPHAGWCMLKSPRSMISPFASLRASFTADRACPLNPSPCGVYTLIIVVSNPSSQSQSMATHGPNCWRFQWPAFILRLTMKHTFVVGAASYERVKFLGQYVDFVNLL